MPGAIAVVTANDIPENGKNNFEFLTGYEIEPVSYIVQKIERNMHNIFHM